MNKKLNNIEKNTIGDISKLLNVSAETIRKYQKKKIVCFDTDDDNNYRYFNLATFNKLLRFLFYRKSKMNISQSELLLNCQEIELLPNILDKQITEIKNEILWQNLLIDRLNELKTIIEYIPLHLNKLSYTTSPDFYYTPYYQDDNMLFENKENINQMVDLMPLSTTCPIFRLSSLDKLEYGLIIESKYASTLQKDNFEYFASKKSLYTIVSVSKANYLNEEDIAYIFEYTKRNNLEIDVILGRTIASIANLNHAPNRYHEFWVILKS